MKACITDVIAVFFLAAVISFSHIGTSCVQGQSAPGPLTVHPTNPRYFSDPSGHAVYMTGSHTWMNLQDFRVSGYPDFDWDEYLGFLVSNNHNFIRLWVTEYEYDKDNDVWATPCPYQRTGPGTAYDGRPLYDLTGFNQPYFDRLRSRVISAGDSGIYVSVMLFSSFGSDYSRGAFVGNDQQEAWLSHPYRGGNNVNGIDGDSNGDGVGSELHTLTDSGVTALQEAYVEKVIDTVNDLDNVIFEVGNEMAYESVAFQYHMIDFIHGYEATKPKQHPVGMTTGGPMVGGGWQNMDSSDLLNSPAEWISPSQDWGDLTNDPPEADGSKIVIVDTDHIPRPEHRDWVWKCLCRGYNPILMDVLQVPYPYDIGEDWNDPDNPLPRRLEQRPAMGHALYYAERMNLAAMTPQSALSSTGYCLANPGSEYLAYHPSPGSFTVNLVAGSYDYEWFNPETGVVEESGFMDAAGGSEPFIPPSSIASDAVLYLSARNPLPPGLMGHWKFDEGSGSAVTDSSGNGNQGTITGASWISGRLGSALNFSGIDDYVSIADSPTLDVTGPLTIAAWVYRNADQNGWRMVVTREEGTSSREHYLLGFLDNSYQFLVNTGSGYEQVSSGIAPNQEWIHLTGTYDGTILKLFVGGTEVGSAPHSGGFHSDNNPVIIGAATNDHGASFSEFFSGGIDDVRIYNKVLTQSEISQLAQGVSVNQPPVVDAGPDQGIILPSQASLSGTVTDDGLPDGTLITAWIKSGGPGDVTFTDPAAAQTSAGFSLPGTYVLKLEASDGDLSASDEITITVSPETSDVVGYWNLDEMAGLTAGDSSGNANDADLIGPAWTSGRLGGALSFDGQDDYIRISDSPVFDASDAFTVAAWILRNSPQDGWRVIVTRERGTGNPEHYYLGFFENGFRWFVNTQDGYSAVDLGSPAPESEWVHMAGTYDGTSVKLFINGQEDFSIQHGGLFVPDDNPITVGAATNDHGSTFKEYFNGTIDEVRIYSRTLTSQEILDIYDSSFHKADISPKDGCVEEHELIPFIDLWKYDSTMYPMPDVMEAVSLWSRGTGCVP